MVVMMMMRTGWVAKKIDFGFYLFIYLLTYLFFYLFTL